MEEEEVETGQKTEKKKKSRDKVKYYFTAESIDVL